MESEDSLEFPRAKRRLLHLNKETEATFTVPTVDDITSSIKKAKYEAINICNNCCMEIKNYNDTILLNDKMSILENALIFDNEIDNNEINNNEQDIAEEIFLPREEAISIKEDMIRLTLIKSNATNLPTYEISNHSDQKGKKYSLTKNGKSVFLVYEGTIIRKTTALYLLQENSQLSNDRLLRVRSEQASHLFDSTKFNYTPANCVMAGDLCLFKSVDNEEKYVLGRIIQFSYLRGNKREREYSSNYCDMTIESRNDIGTFANWFIAVHPTDTSAKEVLFRPVHMLFTAGYVAMSNYLANIEDSMLIESSKLFTVFSVPKHVLDEVLPNWPDQLKFDSDI